MPNDLYGDAPLPGAHVYEMHVWIGIHRNGGEGTPNYDMPMEFGTCHTPLMSSKQEIAEQLGPLARRLQQHILCLTAATWMAIAGVPTVEIARLLGHTDSRTTERVYAKHTPDYLRRAIEALSA